MATWVIGDVQGCHTTFERLLARLGKGDDIWLVGDLVNRGSASLATLRRVIELGAVCVLGNHDLHLLACATGVAQPKGKDTIGEILAARDRDRLIGWLKERPFLHRDRGVTMVHAGLALPWTVDAAERIARELEGELAKAPDAFLAAVTAKDKTARWSDSLAGEERWRVACAAFTRLRTVTPDGTMDLGFKGPPDEAPDGNVPWFDAPGRKSRGQTVVFGHWAALGLRIGKDHVGIDTGCVWGHALTAYRLDDGAIVSEPTADGDRP